MSLTHLTAVEQIQLLHDVQDFIKINSVADIVALFCLISAFATYISKGTFWDKPDPYRHLFFERPQQQQDGEPESLRQTRDISKKLEETGKQCVIFWGSQSGTAEGLAQRLAKDIQSRFSLPTLSADLSDYEAATIAKLSATNLAIFIVSTFGEGDPSDNAYDFWDWIQLEKKPVLSHLRYMALGLGNSNYKYYNKVVDVTAERLTALGAKALLPTAHADDATGQTVEDFMSWRTNVFSVLSTEFGLVERQSTYEPGLEVTSTSEVDESIISTGAPRHMHTNARGSSANASPIKPLLAKNATEIFTSPTRNCIHLELDLSAHPELHYKTGDHLGLWSSNPISEIEILLNSLGRVSEANQILNIRAIDPNSTMHLPSQATLHTLLKHHLEICAPVSRDTLSSLAQFAPSPSSRSFLESLASDKLVYSAYLKQNHLTLGRVLRLASPDQPWTNLPLSYILETLPTMQPRYYSISSSSVISPKRIALTILVSKDHLEPLNGSTPGQIIRGLTSTYALALQRAHSADSTSFTTSTTTPAFPTYDLTLPSAQTSSLSAYAHIRPSKFKLPTPSTPIILIASGTGLAPFRAFILERAKLATLGKHVGEMRLYFGCRGPNEDYIYKDEIAAAGRTLNNNEISAEGGLPGNEVKDEDHKGGKVLHVREAFSRVDGERKVYVQDRVWEDRSNILRLMREEGASLFVCGRAGMAREVGKVLARAAAEQGMGEDEAAGWVEGLKRRGKWREDCWG